MKIVLDTDLDVLHVGDRAIELAPMEALIVRRLVEARGVMVHREPLAVYVFGIRINNVQTPTRNLAVRVSVMKRKILSRTGVEDFILSDGGSSWAINKKYL